MGFGLGGRDAADGLEESMMVEPGDLHPGQAPPAHQPLDRTAGHLDAFAVELTPDLAGAIDLQVGLPDLFDPADGVGVNPLR